MAAQRKRTQNVNGNATQNGCKRSAKRMQTQRKTDANATQCKRRLRSTETEQELFIDRYCT